MLFKSILAATLLAVTQYAAALDSIEVFRHARPSLVQVVGVTPNGRMHMGSGVVLPGGTVITNCHVTLGAKRVQLLGEADAPSASLQAASVDHDLCSLYFPQLQRPPASIGASRKLRTGDIVYAVGFNAGRALSYQPGEVAELFEHDGAMVIRTTAPFTHGASGGGLFDESGNLVGVLTFFRVSQEGTDYFAVPAEWIAKAEAAKAEPIAPLEGMPFWAQAIDRQPPFLQAGALQADGRWEDLAAVAREWTSARPQDGQAWAALAKAASKLGDPGIASTASRRAAALGVVVVPAEATDSTDEK
jgi:serine protease Do